MNEPNHGKKLSIVVDGATYEFDDLPTLKKTEKHTIDVVIDRVKVRPASDATGFKCWLPVRNTLCSGVLAFAKSAIAMSETL